jgi:hypothetical protein
MLRVRKPLSFEAMLWGMADTARVPAGNTMIAIE